MTGVGYWTNEKINSFKLPKNKSALDVGCGKRKIPGAYGIDSDKNSSADLVFNLEKKWPIQNETYDYVFCLNFLEHTLKFNHILEEIYRVLKKGGKLFVEVPYYNSFNYAQVPFHRVPFTETTIHEFYTNEGTFKRYSNAKFKINKRILFFTKPFNLLSEKISIKIAHYISNVCYQIYWELKK